MKIRPLNPAVLKGDPARRFVIPFQTLTKQVTLAHVALFLGRDIFEIEPVPLDFVDRFLVYNATLRLNPEALRKAVNELFGESMASSDIASRLEEIYSGVRQLMAYINGERPFIDHVYGALLLDRVHFAKVKIQTGVDFGAVRIMIRPLATIPFFPYIYCMSLTDIISFYSKMYEDVGRPRIVKPRDRTVVEKLSRYSGKEIHHAIDYTVYEVIGQRIIGFKTFLIFVTSDGHLVLTDAKRLLHGPDLHSLQNVIAIQSGDCAFIIYRLNQTLNDVIQNIVFVTQKLVKQYLSGKATEETVLLSDLTTIVYYGRYSAIEETETSILEEILETTPRAEEEEPIPKTDEKKVEKVIEELEEKATSREGKKREDTGNVIGGEAI